MSIPATDIGSKPTGVNTEYLPPTLLGITKVSYPSSSESFFNAPFLLSVVTYILFLASSTPYLFSKNSLNTLNAIAGSVVVPDFEITLTEISFSPIKSIKSSKYVPLILLPTYNICGTFLFPFSR